MAPKPPAEMPGWLSDLKKELICELKQSIEALVDARVRERTIELEEKLCLRDRELAKLENYVRQGNLEVHGIPHREGEDLEATVKAIAEKYGTTALKTVSLNCYRRGRPAKLPNGDVIPAPIICETRNVLAVNHVIDKAKTYHARNKKDISLADLSMGDTRSQVFVRRNFSDATQYLFRAAKRIGKNKGYKYIWISGGGMVLARKKEGGEKILISHKVDLEKL